MKYLENSNFKIGILPLGAELRSVINKKTNKEYVWQADEKVWPRSSPVLFPFVGKLKNDTYFFNGKEYHLPQHGFARNFEFNIMEESSNKLIFELNSSSETIQNYPFKFTLQLAYELINNELSLEYKVVNKNEEDMFFSIGAHPAFALDEDMENYSLEFEREEELNRSILLNGLRTNEKNLVSMNDKRLSLKKKYFESDAIVLENLNSNSISLLNKKGEKIITLIAEQYPYYGIWSKEPYPFICLEPWEGVADHVNSTGELSTKEGIIKLPSSEVFLRRIAFRFF